MEKLNSQDLMLRDWVQTPEGKRQIPELSTKCCMLNWPDYGCTIADLQPIPLTKEIVERNSLWFDEELDAYNLDGLYVSYNDYYESFDVGSVKVGMCGDTFSSFTSIKWVHELQHILRICQISKKVTL